MRAVKKTKQTLVQASLEDETQQPSPPPSLRPRGRPSSSATGPAVGPHATEPTLKNDPSQPHDLRPAALTYPLGFNEDATRNSRDEHESDYEDSGALLSSPPLSAVKEDKAGEEGDGGRSSASASASPQKRSSPTWVTASTPPPVSTNEDNEAEETEVSELQDSLPPDDASVPTPPDTQIGLPAPPRDDITTPTYRSPVRPLTDHPVPVPPRSGGQNSQTYVSPSNLGHFPSPSMSKTPTKASRRGFFTHKLPPSPAPDSDDDEFTRGMAPLQRPRDVLNTILKQPPEDSLAQESVGTRSSQSSHAGPSQPHGRFASPSKSAPGSSMVSPPKGSDTFVDDEEAPKESTPVRNRFGYLAASHRSSPPAFSDIVDEFNERSRPGSDDEQDFSFKATQVNLGAFTESLSPGKRFRSPSGPPARPSPVRPSPAPRATSTIPAIPEHRRLQRRARTSVSDGQQSAVIRAFERPKSPAFESTFVDAEPPATNRRAAQPPRVPTIQSNDGVDDKTEEDDPAPEEDHATEGNRAPTPPAVPTRDIHEPWGESLARPPPTRYSPNKYGRRASKRPRRSIPSDDPPEDADAEDGASASSTSTPEDPQDQTYHDQPPQESHSSPVAPSPPSLPSPPVSKPAKASKAAPAAGSSTSARGQRGKRKVLSPSPDLSGSSSSSAPEDAEDYTYRPVDKGKGKAKSKPSAPKPAPRSARPAKKAKTVAAASRASSRATSIRAPSAVPAELPSGTPVTPIPDGPVRVLAYWKTGEYFAGTIVGRKKTGYSVKFDDGLAATVPIAKMRLLNLKAGEPVRNGSKSTEDLQVTTPFDGTGDLIEVLDSSSEPMSIHVRSLVVLPAVIEQRFNKRLLDAAVLEARYPLVVGRGSAASVVGKQHPLQGMVFLISRGDARMSDDGIKKRILKNGGAVEDNWQSLFKISNDHYEFKSALTPFVIQLAAKGVMSGKAMAALASGIPILAARFIDDAIDHGADWRNYLVPAGESRYLFPSEPKESKLLWVSQVVDPAWGDDSWSLQTARSVRQPFQSKSILFVEPGSKFEEIKVLIPFCLMALGATVSRAKSIPSNISPYDLVMIEDRDKGTNVTRDQKASGKLVNVAWLKLCLPIGKLLPPSLVSTGE